MNKCADFLPEKSRLFSKNCGNGAGDMVYCNLDFYGSGGKAMRYTENGRTVEYERLGDGERAVLILHGWGCSGEMFRGTAELLAKKYTVLLPDLCGFGGSPEPPAPMSPGDYADLFIGLLASLGITHVSLIGHSYGGRVILKLFEKQSAQPLPFVIDRVMLVDAAGIKPKQSPGARLSLAAYKAGRRILSTKPMQKLFPGAVDAWRKKRGSADYNNASETMKKTLVLAVNEDLAHCLPKVTAPTLLFWGDADDATPLADAKRMEREIPDAGLVVVRGGSHFSFADDPALFRRVLGSFFEL